MDQRFYRAKAVAEATGISENTVRYLIRTGVIAAKRIGRSVLIPAAEFERLVAAPDQTSGETTPAA